MRTLIISLAYLVISVIGIALAAVVVGTIGASYYFGWVWLGPSGVFLAFMMMFLIARVVGASLPIVFIPNVVPLSMLIERLTQEGYKYELAEANHASK